MNILKFFTGKNEKEIKEKIKGDEKKLKDRINNEKVKICGRLKLTGRDKNGKVLFVKIQDNLITNAGFDLVCNVLGLNAQPSDITHMAIGTGAAGNATATTLTTETDRQTAAYAHTPGTKTCTFTATFTSPTAITEYGLLNASSAGSLLNTAGFSAITVDSLEIVATLTLS